MPITGRIPLFLLFFCWVPLLFGTWAAADDDQDGIMVGRIAHLEGKLLRYVAENKDWVATVQDAPFGLEDALYAENGTKAEFLLPNRTWIRIGGNTQLQMIALNPEATTVDVASGLARMYNKNRDAVIKATTPFGYVVAPEGAVFDLYVGDDSMELIAVRGNVDFVHEATGSRYEVRERDASLIADRRGIARGNGTVDAAWDDWNGQRDSLWAKRLRSQSKGAEYLPEQIRDESYALEENGRWERVYYEGDYRSMWRPTRIDPGWRPFTEGRWSVYYGDNCWIPAEPFGYVTHHYGSWVWVDSFRSWYWMPPVVRIVDTAPSLFIAFGWYPGRVGWIHSGSTIGWVPLAPNEDYYCHRPWGRRGVVINRGPAINLNIDRYRYLDRAVIVSADRLYRGNRYTPFVQRLSRTAIVNKYKPAPVINKNVIGSYDTDRRRFTFNDTKVDRKPHATVLGRIDNNRRLFQNAGPLGREQIRQDLDKATVTAIPTTTTIRGPLLSNKVVGAGQANQPAERVSFPTQELKPKDRQRQLMHTGPEPTNQRGGGDVGQGRPMPGQKDDWRRMRSAQDARDRVMQDTAPATPAVETEKTSGDRRHDPQDRDRERGNLGPREPGDQGTERRIRSPREMSPQEGGPSFQQRRQPRDPGASRQEDPRRQQEFQRRQDDQQRMQQENMRRQQEDGQRQQQQEVQRRQDDQQRMQQENRRRQQEETQRQQQQEVQRRQDDQQRMQQENMRRQQEEAQRQQQQEVQRRQADQQRMQQENMRRQQEEAQRQQQQEAQRRQEEQQRMQQQGPGAGPQRP
ncbi:MAG: hypothetical protein LBD10_03685 [Desulfobulbus sp.]|jgi:hypothetical protein|uniref:DUF6600 domain-containing protein n=1 Tax=Desulfobulbus sp. TaxID=895 RepID=UPI002848DA37|nr:DUF6600 domain-containing protein [Desulfobulbus sp.]MDR2549290.1 hypothetical protein [Desulfobulbus sp.]